MTKYGRASPGMETYIANMQTAFKLAKVGAQLASKDWREKRGAMVHNPYGLTIAELSMFQRPDGDAR